MRVTRPSRHARCKRGTRGCDIQFEKASRSSAEPKVIDNRETPIKHAISDTGWLKGEQAEVV
jgi:hypothetical protein